MKQPERKYVHNQIERILLLRFNELPILELIDTLTSLNAKGATHYFIEADTYYGEVEVYLVASQLRLENDSEYSKRISNTII